MEPRKPSLHERTQDVHGSFYTTKYSFSAGQPKQKLQAELDSFRDLCLAGASVTVKKKAEKCRIGRCQ